MERAVIELLDGAAQPRAQSCTLAPLLSVLFQRFGFVRLPQERHHRVRVGFPRRVELVTFRTRSDEDRHVHLVGGFRDGEDDTAFVSEAAVVVVQDLEGKRRRRLVIWVSRKRAFELLPEKRHGFFAPGAKNFVPLGAFRLLLLPHLFDGRLELRMVHEVQDRRLVIGPLEVLLLEVREERAHAHPAAAANEAVHHGVLDRCHEAQDRELGEMQFGLPHATEDVVGGRRGGIFECRTRDVAADALDFVAVLCLEPAFGVREAFFEKHLRTARFHGLEICVCTGHGVLLIEPPKGPTMDR